MKKPNLGSLHRRFTSLFVALVFVVLSVTGVIAFVQPFSIGIVGLHALTGFLFVILAVFHIVNNIRPLKGYLQQGTMDHSATDRWPNRPFFHPACTDQSCSRPQCQPRPCDGSLRNE